MSWHPCTVTSKIWRTLIRRKRRAPVVQWFRLFFPYQSTWKKKKNLFKLAERRLDVYSNGLAQSARRRVAQMFKVFDGRRRKEKRHSRAESVAIDVIYDTTAIFVLTFANLCSAPARPGVPRRSLRGVVGKQ